jgi:hypothetical protein
LLSDDWGEPADSVVTIAPVVERVYDAGKKCPLMS